MANRSSKLLQSTNDTGLLLIPCSYSRAIPFEVTLCNVDFKDNNSVAYLEKFYLRTDNEERLPGYCNTLLQGLHEEMASNPSSKVSAILSAISTTLSVLRASDNPVVFERTKSRVFGAKALMDILIAKSANTIVESSTSGLGLGGQPKLTRIAVIIRHLAAGCSTARRQRPRQGNRWPHHQQH